MCHVCACVLHVSSLHQSGLNVGFMALDPLKLAVMAEAGDEQERNAVSSVLPILKDHHLLLVTLLLWNAAAMEALPIFLDALTPAWLAIVLSVSAVLLFGEILPQAFCTSNPLKIGAKAAPLVRFLSLLSYPIAKPVRSGARRAQCMCLYTTVRTTQRCIR
jgi:metal transporter CNNM